MKIEPLSIEGAFKITPKNISDSRGAFARLFCSEIFVDFSVTNGDNILSYKCIFSMLVSFF